MSSKYGTYLNLETYAKLNMLERVHTIENIKKDIIKYLREALSSIITSSKLQEQVEPNLLEIKALSEIDIEELDSVLKKNQKHLETNRHNYLQINYADMFKFTNVMPDEPETYLNMMRLIKKTFKHNPKMTTLLQLSVFSEPSYSTRETIKLANTYQKIKNENFAENEKFIRKLNNSRYLTYSFTNRSSNNSQSYTEEVDNVIAKIQRLESEYGTTPEMKNSMSKMRKLKPRLKTAINEYSGYYELAQYGEKTNTRLKAKYGTIDQFCKTLENAGFNLNNYYHYVSQANQHEQYELMTFTSDMTPL